MTHTSPRPEELNLKKNHESDRIVKYSGQAALCPFSAVVAMAIVTADET